MARRKNKINENEMEKFKRINKKIGQIGTHWTISEKEFEFWEKIADFILRNKESKNEKES